MKNREIYLEDPVTRKLVNQGVASVNDDRTSQAMAVLRYEIETFVCDGQYKRGLEHILETYLKNIDQSQQPAVWVSGFYGSGKSHELSALSCGLFSLAHIPVSLDYNQGSLKQA
ncbi:MAG: hypothetical protein PF503_25315 [Desulfobacula sp.]|jgi:hypothetical protein|nr:hypothetical protein [Desulfobacula sp.]